MRIVYYLALFPLAVACAGPPEPPRARVECEIGKSHYADCRIHHTGGEGPAEVCWTAKVICANGARYEGNSCATVQPEGVLSQRVLMEQSIPGLACDQAVSFNMPKLIVR